ncbi:MAG: 3'(2'),5'-bisphosphate nucleotidase CysQ [Geminicoccaceae bacterium]|nr:3'(2'),5'-bisphosphate nucleotidase CysQ [Geminicoccaceae bacterium]MCS7267647.1 3'(2'),5'-bisphosphate nucleotidase CysQ [Geminicoccaceae bacterium]MCX7630055.1 3'(2'),5'-bisphosphate nucleotidase CysQ [Geminicoccaceae bacterium]MDW8123490.1 3'(2'),5'-bisphosphate nucleotidase CysQ [Geminicoccaceae bacterium]MDW8342162.1 3'(2'),5'-bisphosphate nucleotidase CysQ [Geminicoccaceae bacterium]
MVDPSILLPSLLALVARAGAIVLEHYGQAGSAELKADASPVTAADRAAERFLEEGLSLLAPGLPIVAEEAVAAGRVPRIEPPDTFWLVDPLDGTREFLSRNGEFTINVGLVRAGVPILGVVAAPALDRLWWAIAGRGAFRREGGSDVAIRTRHPPPEGLVAVASRSHRDPETDAWLARHPVRATVSAGSALKFCLVAEGRADVYPRFGRTMEWDTAAGQAILEAAGGRVETVEGGPLRYGKPGFANPGFVAWGA